MDAAEASVRNYVPDDVGTTLREARESALRGQQNPNYMHGAILAVQRTDFICGLWFAEMRLAAFGPPEPDQVDDCKWAGDSGNSAVFIIEKYAPRKPDFCPMADLKLTAAHAILQAGLLNPGGIEGLEILMCPHGDKPFERVSDEELKDLRSQSLRLDRVIAGTLAPSRRKKIRSTHL
jgi:hypothetical protein